MQSRSECPDSKETMDSGHMRKLKWTKGEGRYPTDNLSTRRRIFSRSYSVNIIQFKIEKEEPPFISNNIRIYTDATK